VLAALDGRLRDGAIEKGVVLGAEAPDGFLQDVELAVPRHPGYTSAVPTFLAYAGEPMHYTYVLLSEADRRFY